MTVVCKFPHGGIDGKTGTEFKPVLKGRLAQGAARKGGSMKNHIQKRVLTVANFIINSRATVREAAKKFGVSKSTVYKDITVNLFILNPELAMAAKNVLEYNKSERHIRGGLSTKEKYLKIST